MTKKKLPGRRGSKPSVAEVPELLETWDMEANSSSPEGVTLGSERKFWWRCPNHDFPYSATPYSRSRGRGCNVCAGKVVVAGYNDLESTGRKFIKEWWSEKNPLKPSEVSARSNKPVWWRCELGHTWEESPDFRVRRGDGCSFCLNKRVWEGYNDLATTHPELASEWHPTKNSLKSSEVTRGSDYKAWWLCSEGHEWSTWVYARAVNGCPECWAASTQSKIETALSELLPVKEVQHAPEAYWPSGRRMTVDILLDDEVTVVEYDGSWWHQGQESRDIYKTLTLLGKGYRVIRIRENHLPSLPPMQGVEQIRFMHSYETLEQLAVEVLAARDRLDLLKV